MWRETRQNTDPVEHALHYKSQAKNVTGVNLELECMGRFVCVLLGEKMNIFFVWLCVQAMTSNKEKRLQYDQYK